MIPNPFRSRRAAPTQRPGTVAPQALAKARRLATPYVRALTAAERATPSLEGPLAGRVFQVLSPDGSNLAATATGQLAWAARVALGRRTLMLEHQSVESRRTTCERVNQRRADDLPWHPRLRLPNDRPPAVLAEVLRRARRSYEVTLLAGRDIATDPETLKCAGLADGVILLVAADRTRAQDAREVLKAVKDAGGRPVGVLMVGHKERVPSWAGSFARSWGETAAA